MISSTQDGYYDLEHNRVQIRGLKCSDDTEDAKMITYPSVLQNIYCITKDGRVYSMINANYLS